MMKMLDKKEVMTAISTEISTKGNRHVYRLADDSIDTIGNIKDRVNRLGTIQMTEAVGFWEETHYSDTVVCSNCRRVGNTNWDFCPYCGSLNSNNTHNKLHVNTIKFVPSTEKGDE